jgi:phosphotransferase system enzyme I (PtsI)
MEIIKGIGVSSGVVICPAFLLTEDEIRIGRRAIKVTEIDAEKQRLQKAISLSSDDIRELRDSTTRNLGKETGAIFYFHLGLLNDPELLKAFISGIEQQHYTAEYAVHKALREYGKHFLEHPDKYFRERIKDIYDIERRLLHKLAARDRIRLADVDGPVIIVAKDLTPSQTAALDRKLVKGIAIEAGGQTSHTAIIANSMGIPAVVGLENITHEAVSGDLMVVNGYSGVVIVDPDEVTITEHKKYEKRVQSYETKLEAIRDLPAKTLDGVDIKLMGNIEFPHEVENALEKGAVGIGLYRTEFLYLAAEREPTEDDHYAAYAETIRRLGGRPIIIRTLDLGADKYSPFLDQAPEANPFLGCRSIRLCLQNIEMFKTQLRAILRASVLGDVSVMFPMISTPRELRQARFVLNEVMDDLDEHNIPYNRYIRVGMMVEVPSAALLPHS